MVNLGRLMGIDPTLALNGTNQRFIQRFRELEGRLRREGSSPEASTLETMDRIWEEIKREAHGTAR